jgi:hypothetical protein
MTKNRKIKKSKQQKPQAELSEEQLDTVSGGIIAVCAPGRSADEAPKENVTFEYGKLQFKYTPQT